MKLPYDRTILGLLWDSEYAERTLRDRLAVALWPLTMERFGEVMARLVAEGLVQVMQRDWYLDNYVISVKFYALTPQGRRLVSQGNLTDPPSPSSLVG